MKHSFNLFAFTLAFAFSLGVSANYNVDSSETLEPHISKLQTIKTRMLHVTDEITGAFDVVVSARFDSISGGSNQRVFDFGNGPGLDNIVLTQLKRTTDMSFAIYIDGIKMHCVATNAIIQGELATWKAGVNSDGFLWLEKNGSRVCSIKAQVPRNVARANKLIGQSNWAKDTPLKGAVLGIDITNAGEFRDGFLLNKPDQIQGAFVVSAEVRFDAPQAGHYQRVFDFGNGAEKDNIVLTQYSDTNDMLFKIYRDGVIYALVAPGVIVTDEYATWKVGVDADGLMWMEKFGTLVAQRQGIVPAAVQRNSNLVGSSNWGGDTPLDGLVFSLTVSPSVTVPTLLVADD